MWKALDSNFFINLCLEDVYEIYITDYINIWYKYFTKSSFIECLKASNVALEFEDENFYVEKGINMLNNLDKLKRLCLKKEENDGSLSVSMTISYEYAFKFSCKFAQGSKELFFCNITQPLLKTIQTFQSGQEELLRIMRQDKKMAEIKSEDGLVALKHLKCLSFDEIAHRNYQKSYGNNFGDTNIPATVIDKHIDIPEKQVKLEEPLVFIKIESHTYQENEQNGNEYANRDSEMPMDTKNDVEQMENQNGVKLLVKTEPSSNSKDDVKRKRKKGLNY